MTTNPSSDFGPYWNSLDNDSRLNILRKTDLDPDRYADLTNCSWDQIPGELRSKIFGAWYTSDLRGEFL